MSGHTIDPSDTKRLRRSRSNRMLAGVCAGLAEYFEIHPAVFRVAFVVIALLPGAGLLIYLAAALVVPDEGRDDSIVGAALRDRRTRPWPLVGLGLVAIASAMLVSPAVLRPRDGIWVLPLIFGVVMLWLARRDVAGEGAPRAAARAAEDRRRLRRLLGVLALAFAATIPLAAASVAILDVDVHHGVGERSHLVASRQALRSEYRLGIGELRVDLSTVALPVGETHVATWVDVGALHVVVPDGVALRVRADAGLGDIDLLAESVDGYDVKATLDQDGPRVLVLDAHVKVGSVDVIRGLP